MRLYGRTFDIYSLSKYLLENYKRQYKKDETIISGSDLEDVASVITPYLSHEHVEYLNDADIEILWNRHIKDTIYSGVGEETNAIFFPTREMKEEYKRDLLYFMGDLLRRISLDYIPNEFDISCQYSDVIPLLIEYLYLKEIGKEDRFSPKHLDDLSLDAEEYIKRYDRFNKKQLPSKEEAFLRDSLLYLVPLSSMDATLQIGDEIAQDKDALKAILKELIENPDHNREEVMKKRNIETFGFKRLRKEIDRRK